MKLFIEVYRVDCTSDPKKPFKPCFLSFTLNPQGIVYRTKTVTAEPVEFKKNIVKYELTPGVESIVKINIHQMVNIDKPCILAHVNIRVLTIPLNRRINTKFLCVPEKPMKEQPKIFIKMQLSDDETPPFKAPKSDLLTTPHLHSNESENTSLPTSASSDDLFSVFDPFLSLMAQHLTSGRSMHRAQFFQQVSAQKVEKNMKSFAQDPKKITHQAPPTEKEPPPPEPQKHSRSDVEPLLGV